MIKVIIKSFFIIEIISYLKFLKFNIIKKYNFIGPFFLPKKIEKNTLLISPHVDKNARDQIQIKTYTSIIYIKKYDYDLIFFLLKNKVINGIDIKYLTYDFYK